MVFLVKEVFLGGTGENDFHVLEILQLTQCPALPPDVTVQWRQLAEKTYPHMLHAVFPTGVSVRGNTHQELSLRLDALRVCGAKPLHSHAGLKRVVGTGATAQQPELQV